MLKKLNFQTFAMMVLILFIVIYSTVEHVKVMLLS